MKSESGVRGDVEMAFAVFAAPTFTRSEKIGFVADAAMRTANITNIVRISLTVSF
jgi:hypothetical protein